MKVILKHVLIVGLKIRNRKIAIEDAESETPSTTASNSDTEMIMKRLDSLEQSLKNVMCLLYKKL